MEMGKQPELKDNLEVFEGITRVKRDGMFRPRMVYCEEGKGYLDLVEGLVNSIAK